MTGKGLLDLYMWRLSFSEEVRVMTTLPDMILLERRLWRKHKLQPDLEEIRASIVYGNERIYGSLVRNSHRTAENRFKAVQVVIEDSEVDDAIREMELSKFSYWLEMQERLHNLIWRRQYIFKGLERIKRMQHIIAQKSDVKLVCSPVRRCSSKEEEAEKRAMQKLIRLEVLEPSRSLWARKLVFVGKKEGDIRVTSDFRRLKTLIITESYPMENMRDIFDWMGSRRIFSVFDFKKSFLEIELQVPTNECTDVGRLSGAP